MRIPCGTILAAVTVAVAANAGTIFEAKMPFGPSQFRMREMETEYGALKKLCAAEKMQWWDEFVPCCMWLCGSGLPKQYYSRDFVHSGEYGKQIIGRVMLGYFLTGK